MKRAVIYARYSTDLQNDQSVEDQIRLCQGHATRIGASVVNEFFDRAKSGASMFGRPGLSALMQAADRGEFDVLISEAADRISRDIADLAHIHKTLKFRNIEMNCVNGGIMDTLQIGMYGVIGQMQREEGAKKVRRGMVGVVRSGRNAGGKAYGYRPVPGKAGELEIVEEEAAVVRRVFELYVSGISPRSIAAALNADSIPAPRGKQWNASTINGNEQRGYGILRNPLYTGKLIWNRVHMVKDPMTGRRISRVNDESVIETVDAAHLRIVEDATFEAARARKMSVSTPKGPMAPRSKRLLSGLLRCGVCGGGMTIDSSDRSGPRVRCSVERESGSCGNNGRYYIEKIERGVVDRLRVLFADTSVIDAYVEEYKVEARRTAAERRGRRAATQRELNDVQSQIKRILDQVAKGTIDDEDVVEILPGMKAERERLRGELELEEPNHEAIEIKPLAIRKFQDNVNKLSEILKRRDREPDVDLSLSFREIVSSVVVEPRTPGEEYRYEIKGWLAGIAGENLSSLSMVAEEGSVHKRRQPRLGEISLGNWQIEVGRAIKAYLEGKAKPKAA